MVLCPFFKLLKEELKKEEVTFTEKLIEVEKNKKELDACNVSAYYPKKVTNFDSITLIIGVNPKKMFNSGEKCVDLNTDKVSAEGVEKLNVDPACR